MVSWDNILLAWHRAKQCSNKSLFCNTWLFPRKGKNLSVEFRRDSRHLTDKIPWVGAAVVVEGWMPAGTYESTILPTTTVVRLVECPNITINRPTGHPPPHSLFSNVARAHPERHFGSMAPLKLVLQDQHIERWCQVSPDCLTFPPGCIPAEAAVHYVLEATLPNLEKSLKAPWFFWTHYDIGSTKSCSKKEANHLVTGTHPY